MCLMISDSLRGMSLEEKWTYEDPASLVILFFTHCATYCCLSHSSRSSNRDTPGGAPRVLRIGALGVPSRIGGERFARTSFKRLVVLRHVVHMRDCFQANSLVGKHSVVSFFVAAFPCVRLGLPMETLLDPCWRVISELILGGMDMHG